MNAITALVQGFEGAAFVRHVLPWQSACCVLLIVGAMKFLSERSRRKTLLAITTQAPPGTVVTQEGGMGGPKMCIQVGDGAVPLLERDS